MITGVFSCGHTSVQKPELRVKNYYLEMISAADSTAGVFQRSVSRETANPATLQQLFKALRLAYKKTELFAAYYTPLTAKSINGAPLPSVDENDQHTIEAPEGLQVIEPLVFPVVDTANRQELLTKTAQLRSNFKRLKLMAEQQELAGPQVFDALRLEVFRTMTLCLSGFDAPMAQTGVLETAAAYQAIEQVLALYEQKEKARDSVLGTARRLFKNAIAYLQQHSDFNTFNRMEFIRNYGNRASALLLDCAAALNITLPGDLRPLKVKARTLFDTGAFNPDYYTAREQDFGSSDKRILGKKLFYDVLLSDNGQRSCASCHRPDKAFADGVKKQMTLDGTSQIRRNTPTLLYAGLQPALFYDNRVNYLEDQAREVIGNKDEMHGSLERAVLQLKQDSAYRVLFRKAFHNEKEVVSTRTLLNALGSYVRTLNAFNAPFDQYMRGNLQQLNDEQVKGFNLYMGKARCGSCHFMPLFNGTLPPEFTAIETEVLGVPERTNGKTVDPDPGKYDLRKISLYRYAFKTPTLRNIALTAPYMHNGVYKSLEEVMAFYNRGGGAGVGIHLPNQTLSADALHLSDQEIRQVIAFLNALTDH
ncbi:cytochrome C peroxidase [Niabella sp. CC-SYL272]|uniref:cytochrome-c peroxidase n=1 Tax=Niabella agricola TaxID=2891571 RepID=UPI001F34D1C6|nr:cytochrome c peroxidase [Niabella agricola]MCF3108880.1 cytochrome C peroxidase [Niabella agricola]